MNGTSGMKVSWQVTGIHKDPWANAHRIGVEKDISDNERGYYIHPELHSQPPDRGMSSLHLQQEIKIPLLNKNR